MKFEDLRIGDGRAAERGHEVEIRYDLFLNRGDRVQVQQPHRFRLGERSVVAGLEYGVEGMREGGVRRLRVGPHLGYGSTGLPGVVPPGAVLEFHIRLLRVESPAHPTPPARPRASDVFRRAFRALVSLPIAFLFGWIVAIPIIAALVPDSTSAIERHWSRTALAALIAAVAAAGAFHSRRVARWTGAIGLAMAPMTLGCATFVGAWRPLPGHACFGIPLAIAGLGFLVIRASRRLPISASGRERRQAVD